VKSFSEEEIRPRALMEDKRGRLDADRDYLLSRRAEWVTVPCPACDAAEHAPRLQKLGFSYSECVRCGTLFTNPRPSPAVLHEFYASSQNYAYWNAHIFPASETVRRERIFRPRAERTAELCRKHGVGTGTLLEVGAAFGTFCEEMRRLAVFQRIVAVEPTPDLAAKCRERGLEVLEMPVEKVPAAVRADVVASFEVIEHLFSPRDYVLQCAQVLVPGGLLVLTCPNIRGFDLATLGVLSDSIDHEHLNYFHTRSLPLLLERSGFDMLEVSTPGRLDAELVRKHALSGALDLSGQPWLRELLVDRFETLGGPFQDFLAAQGMSSHMWAVARKRA
jgi:SAM-dependent methyltransferase